MTRFYFDTSIGETSMRDEEGLEYAEEARARRDARRSLVALVAEALAQEAQCCAVTMRDSSGEVTARFFANLGEDRGTA